MKVPCLRFTNREKFAILREIYLIGLESVVKKYNLDVEILVRWQKKFKGTKAGRSIHFIKDKFCKKQASKAASGKQMVSEKEDELLRLVASLIVQHLLEKDKPDR
jgi:hypothetical protein